MIILPFSEFAPGARLYPHVSLPATARKTGISER
jgi:hypothetical protein